MTLQRLEMAIELTRRIDDTTSKYGRINVDRYIELLSVVHGWKPVQAQVRGGK